MEQGLELKLSEPGEPLLLRLSIGGEAQSVPFYTTIYWILTS